MFAAFGGSSKCAGSGRLNGEDLGGARRGGFAGWHVLCFSSSSVKVFAKTMNQEPLFDQGVWITPMVLAVCGIAAALCALVLA